MCSCVIVEHLLASLQLCLLPAASPSKAWSALLFKKGVTGVGIMLRGRIVEFLCWCSRRLQSVHPGPLVNLKAIGRISRVPAIVLDWAAICPVKYFVTCATCPSETRCG